MTQKCFSRPTLFALTGLLMSAALAGCDQKKEASQSSEAANAALPLAVGSATPIVPAPPVASLPPAPRIQAVRAANRSDDYAYIDRAYYMSGAIGQAPPDYGFDFEGVHPWAWNSARGDVRLVEPVDGGYRYYYYRAGATEPYLVRDPRYSYGYSDGRLVAVYDSEGYLLPPEEFDQRIDNAGRYLARAAALYEASRQAERRRVNAANWAQQRADLDAARSRWAADQSRQEAWRAYHAQHEAEEQAYWLGERYQREQSARSFDDWSRRNFNGPPPRPVGYAGDAAAQPPAGFGRQNNGAQQTQQQTSVDQARSQSVRGTAAADQQAQAKAAADAAAQQQKAQADAARAQKRAEADAARQAQAKAAADQRAQAKAAADAAAQQQRAQADAARAQQLAQADAARQAKAKAAADQQAQARAGEVKAEQLSQAKHASEVKERGRANQTDVKKANDDARPHDSAQGQ